MRILRLCRRMASPWIIYTYYSVYLYCSYCEIVHVNTDQINYIPNQYEHNAHTKQTSISLENLQALTSLDILLQKTLLMKSVLIDSGRSVLIDNLIDFKTLKLWSQSMKRLKKLRRQNDQISKTFIKTTGEYFQYFSNKTITISDIISINIISITF